MTKLPGLLQLAVVLGASPLLTGTVIYGTWRATSWRWLVTAGLYSIPLGIAAFFIGMVALLLHVRRESRVQGGTSGALWLQGALVGGLLLSNFPAALLIMASAFDVHTRYTVNVRNEGDRPIESLVVVGPGVRIELGPIAPGRRARRHMNFSGEGSLNFEARQGELVFGGLLDGYVTSDLGGETSIRVLGRGVYEIRPVPP